MPEKITHLTFGWSFYQKINLPWNVSHLIINSSNKHLIENLHDGIIVLELHSCFNLELNNLPQSIKKLIIYRDTYNYELNCLPNNIEYLRLPECYDKPIKNYPKLEIYIDTPNIEKSINQCVKRLGGIASPAPAMINKKL